MKLKEVAILGAGGYTGRELLRLLQQHPVLKATQITSDKYSGENLSTIFPEHNISKLKFQKHDAPLKARIPIFLATPNDISLIKVPELMEGKHPLVDLSGAFRLHNQKTWENSYKMPHTAFTKMSQIVYGMPELFREEIKEVGAIANPGCYATAAILPLTPLVTKYRNELHSISIQASSGVSGAGGRIESGGFPFSKVYENYRAYKVLRHQHEPEIIEYTLTNPYTSSKNNIVPSDSDTLLTFVPHLLPIHRGILCTTVLHWKGVAPTQEIETILQQKMDTEHFMRLRNSPEDICLSDVQYTNYIDIGLRSQNSTTVIISAIDNLVKGAAGQAIQNMNLILGLPEEMGLL